MTGLRMGLVMSFEESKRTLQQFSCNGLRGKRETYQRLPSTPRVRLLIVMNYPLPV